MKTRSQLIGNKAFIPKSNPDWVTAVAEKLFRTGQDRTAFQSIRCGRVHLGAGLVMAASAVSTLAQPVFVAPPAPAAQAPAPSRTLGDSEDGEGILSILGESFAPGLPFAWRKMVFRPSISYSFTYGDDVLSSTNRQQKTIVQSISPGMNVEIGERWNFNYTPSITLYSDSNFEDVVNHSARLSGSTSHEDWTFGLTASASRTSRPETETAQQTDQQQYSTSFSIDRQLNADLSAQLTTGFNAREAQQFTSSRNYNAMAWLNQQVGMNLGISAGVGGGFEDVEVGTDMTYQTFKGRVTWSFTDKVSFSANGGIDNRQFLQSESDGIFPVYGLSLTYRPFLPTVITVSGNRSIGASLLRNLITESTSFSLSLQQRLLKHLRLDLSASHSVSTYSQTFTGLTFTREDQHTTYRAGLSMSFLKRASASIFYAISKNESDVQGFSYNSNQVGFDLSYAY